MNLQPIYPATPGYKVLCLRCAQWVLMADAFADLDGESFKAYYCTPCKEKVKGEKA